MRLLALLAPALLAACAVTPAERAHEQAAAADTQAKLAARLAGYTQRAPVECIQEFPNRQTTAYGAKILYSDQGGGRGGTLYVNDTTGGCEGMGHGDYLVTVSHTGELCAGDIGRTFQQTSRIPTGSCALGKFTPYVRNR